MSKQRVMMVGLDGFEPSVAEALLAQGRLPVLQRLREQGATTPLDHGAAARRTGLAWEHVSSGLPPEDARRWGAVDFDPESYAVHQRFTSLQPFPARLAASTVVFDAPYFDITKAAEVTGLVAWGAHDAGIAEQSRPAILAEEIRDRFGAYPAREWIYGFVWPSAARAQEMADGLVRAVELRADIAEWLYGERLPDWELGYLVVSEYHSAAEALWHGIDPSHPLACLPSARPARDGIEGVYVAGDRLLGRLIERFPGTVFVVFNLHGMGPNDSDLASMALLPELLYRHSKGAPLAREQDWAAGPNGQKMVAETADWSSEINRGLPQTGLVKRAVNKIARLLGLATNKPAEGTIPITWMPAERYRGYWPEMTAFALPSFYDGRIRINLRKRESRGRVAPEDYTAVCDEIEALLRACRDPVSGEPIIRDVLRNPQPPLAIDGNGADLTVLWAGAPVGFVHPELGRIGPLPYRRTGGHTGGHGVAYFAGPGIQPGPQELRSAFDVVPTVVDLLGEQPGGKVSGTSMASLIS